YRVPKARRRRPVPVRPRPWPTTRIHPATNSPAPARTSYDRQLKEFWDDSCLPQRNLCSQLRSLGGNRRYFKTPLQQIYALFGTDQTKSAAAPRRLDIEPYSRIHNFHRQNLFVFLQQN